MGKSKILANLDAFISMCCLALLLGTIILQVILRFVFSSPLMGAEELTRFMVICVVMLPLAFAERSGSTVVMEEIQSFMSPGVRKATRAAVEVFSTVIYGLLTASAVSVLLNNAQNRTATLEMPFWLFFAPSVIGLAAMTAVRCITVFCKLSHRELPWVSQ